MSSFLVCKSSDLNPGEMRKFPAGNTEILLCNLAGTFTAVHPKCSHYGAPLEEGVLNGFRIVCPWHHACFDARTGRHLEAPGCDALKSYPVDVREGDVWVRVDEESEEGFTHNPMSLGKRKADLPYVIVGGGPGAIHAAEGLRQGGYDGPITMITSEEHLPYDRTQLTKGFLSGDRSAKKMLLRPAKFFKTHHINVMLGKRVTKVDVTKRQVVLANGQEVKYAKCCVATGSAPKALDVRGSQLPGILPIRTWEDAEAVREAVKGKKEVVIVGSSFIGLEAAMVLAKAECKVTVIAPEEVPFGKTFGTRVGKVIQRWHEDAGVHFRLDAKIDGFEGVRKVTALRLENGDKLKASVVLYGIGVRPNSKLIDGIDADESGGIRVNRHMYAGDDLWVAGDIASAPQAVDGSYARIEHWRVAAQQGTVAGNHMAGTKRSLMSVPFFWTNQAGQNLRYAGHHTDADQILFDGRPEEGPFLAFYVEVNQVSAVLGFGRDKDVAAIHELMWLREMPRADKLKLDTDWVALLKKTSSL